MTKKINVKVLAASVCVACASFGATSAQADSLLAPLVISDIANGFETTLSFKVRGTGVTDHRWARFGSNEDNITDLHYIWLQKGNNIGSLFNLGGGCNHVDNNGSVSPWDMISQTINPTLQALAQNPATDATISGSVSATIPGGNINNPSTPFYGMAILDDVASLGNEDAEGNSSGFAYVINYFTGMMLDYKLVNNHKTAASGDFSAGFMRKTSVDLSWNPVNRDLTLWLAVATGAGMASGNGWAGSIRISQDLNESLGTQQDPKVPHGTSANSTGVYDNDEVNLSGDSAVNITCMGLFTRNNFMNTTQLAGTVDGGWTRKSIIGSNGSTGGMVYKAELKLIPSVISGTAVTSFQSETSGHLSLSGGSVPHPNRPY